MPKININGITREMTAEEVAEMEELAKLHPAPEKSAEERLSELTEEFTTYKEQVETEKAENDAALMELASLVDSLSTRADEHEGALVELAGLAGETE